MLRLTSPASSQRWTAGCPRLAGDSSARPPQTLPAVRSAPPEKHNNHKTKRSAQPDKYNNHKTIRSTPPDKYNNHKTIRSAPPEKHNNHKTIRSAPPDIIQQS